jgi:trk system potassium uptake protein TrkA
MKKQALVIGLGQFGMSLAQSLSERGVEVLAVDRNAESVQQMSRLVTEAVVFDATDEDSLLRAAPDNRDLCVCCIGQESRESAIITTALLRQMGAPRIVARASDALTERILYLVGAHEVVNPEKAFGERLASKMLHEGLVDEVPLGDDLVITQIRTTEYMVGKTLIDLMLPKQHDVIVVAIRRTMEKGTRLIMPDPNASMREDDVLVVVSSPEAVHKLLEKK